MLVETSRLIKCVVINNSIMCARCVEIERLKASLDIFIDGINHSTIGSHDRPGLLSTFVREAADKVRRGEFNLSWRR